MDNPARTAQYLARMDERRGALRELLEHKLSSAKQIVWELGCGHGHFLTAYAQAHPERLCVGIDIVGDRIERAIRKRDRAGLANLHFVRAEARLFIEELPLAVRLLDVFVLFPDPWPKLRHHKHRIMQPEFLGAIAARGVANTRLFFRTDFAPYFNDTEAVLRDHPAWTLSDEPWPFEHETVFQSRAASHASLVAVRRPMP